MLYLRGTPAIDNLQMGAQIRLCSLALSSIVIRTHACSTKSSQLVIHHGTTLVELILIAALKWNIVCWCPTWHGQALKFILPFH